MTSKNGIGSWVALAILILLLVLAIIFMMVGWTSGDMDAGQQMSGAGYVAMTFGIVVTLALGIGLMTLVFYSSRKGHD
ncbi:MAG: hypothetical protein JSS04_17485 [Proteobacteria bacterium]|nr:hypothetical protein [Pseudomonadota bacterium]